MKSKRISLTIQDKCTFDILRMIAHNKEQSVSKVVNDLIEEALAIYEDAYWAKKLDERLEETKGEKMIPHDQLWKDLGVDGFRSHEMKVLSCIQHPVFF